MAAVQTISHPPLSGLVGLQRFFRFGTDSSSPRGQAGIFQSKGKTIPLPQSDIQPAMDTAQATAAWSYWRRLGLHPKLIATFKLRNQILTNVPVPMKLCQ